MLVTYYEEANSRILAFFTCVLNLAGHSGIQQGFEMPISVEHSANSFICVVVNLYFQMV